MELGADSKLAFAMISHPRLGGDTHGAGLEDEIVRLILEATLEEIRVALPREILRDSAQWGQLPFERSWGLLRSVMIRCDRTGRSILDEGLRGEGSG